MAYDCPGNLRELEHLLERLVVLAENRLISQERHPIELLIEEAFKEVQKIRNVGPLKEAIRGFEQRYIGA